MKQVWKFMIVKLIISESDYSDYCNYSEIADCVRQAVGEDGPWTEVKNHAEFNKVIRFVQLQNSLNRKFQYQLVQYYNDVKEEKVDWSLDSMLKTIDELDAERERKIKEAEKKRLEKEKARKAKADARKKLNDLSKEELDSLLSHIRGKDGTES